MWFCFTSIVKKWDCKITDKKPDFIIRTSKSLLKFVIVILIPVVILITVSILLCNGLRRFKSSRTEELNDTEQRMARIGFVIVIIFIICHSVRVTTICSFHILDFNNRPIADRPYWYRLLMNINPSPLILNSSVNFLVYFLHTGKVKEALANIMLKHRNSSYKVEQQFPASTVT